MLKEFVAASEGNVNKEFWRNMFKYHSQKKYGAPNIIDGWIVKFFPYNNEGKRNNLDSIVKTDKLPSEMVKVDIKHLVTDGSEQILTPLELWSGFVGLEQDAKTMALRPKIGWMIRKKANVSDVSEDLIRKFEENSEGDGLFGLRIRVAEVPKELLQLDKIKSIEIQFINDIFIPEEMGKIEIDQMILSGKISKKELKKIVKLFPEAVLTINNKEYNYKYEYKGKPVEDKEGAISIYRVKEKVK